MSQNYMSQNVSDADLKQAFVEGKHARENGFAVSVGFHETDEESNSFKAGWNAMNRQILDKHDQFGSCVGHA